MKLLKPLLAALALLVAATPAIAEKDPVYTGTFSNLAVQGYDTVAYFTDGEPVKGSKMFSTLYKGAEFRFASQEHLDAFLAMPEKYAPQYGGYCAWAVAQGYTAKGSAKHWKIVDGKLYLNYNASVQEDWDADIESFIKSGDANWPSVIED